MTDREPTIEEMRQAWDLRERRLAKQRARHRATHVKRNEYARTRNAEIMRLARLARDAGLG